VLRRLLAPVLLLFLSSCGRVGLSDSLNAVVDHDGTLFVRSCDAFDRLVRVEVLREGEPVLDAVSASGGIDIGAAFDVLAALDTNELEPSVSALGPTIIDGDLIHIWTQHNYLGFRVDTSESFDRTSLRCS
jgi:hypothetical protein